MANHGIDAAKLKTNLDALLTTQVERGLLPCAQARVIRRGEVVYDNCFGLRSIESNAPIAQNSIYRIYSMSKVFTSVAALMLMEEGRFKLHDPLSKYIEEYKKPKVAVTSASGAITYIPAKREINVRDLFTMASGIPYPSGDTPSEKAMLEIWKKIERDEKKGTRWTQEMFVREIGRKVPLNFHPGEHWWYGTSIDILGVLVEVVSGMTLGQFMQERIFDPLDLKDTGFYVPEDKRDRFVTMYNGQPGSFTPSDDDDYFVPDRMQGGGGGLVSTARDVSIFAEMLLAGGAYGGKRLLSRKSVELMRTNHLSEQQLKDYTWDTQRGYGYGLGVRVMMHPETAGFGSVGEFAWDGMAGTWFMVDPSEEMTAVLMIQRNPGSHYEIVPYVAQCVYGAVAD